MVTDFKKNWLAMWLCGKAGEWMHFIKENEKRNIESRKKRIVIKKQYNK